MCGFQIASNAACQAGARDGGEPTKTRSADTTFRSCYCTAEGGKKKYTTVLGFDASSHQDVVRFPGPPRSVPREGWHQQQQQAANTRRACAVPAAYGFRCGIRERSGEEGYSSE